VNIFSRRKLNVLVVGGGAREHALGWKLKQSPLLGKLFFAPGNAGTALLGENLSIPAEEVLTLRDWALENNINLTIAGPEAPLTKGIFDLFAERNLLLLGPSQKASILEGSKIWAKQFMKKYGIPTANAVAFDSLEKAKAYVKTQTFPQVIKADGLAQGKGVVVCHDLPHAEEVLENFMEKQILGDAGKKILVEEFLTGEEVSTFALLHADGFCYLGEARDYKRAFDGNKGPNTGGMGSISTSGLVSSKDREAIKNILALVWEGLKREKIFYQGILFAGLILTPDGVKVLEFNVRFGDPEAQVLLPRINDDLLVLFYEAIQGKRVKERVSTMGEKTIGVVIAAKGYPGAYEKGMALPDLSRIPRDILVFHANTSIQNGKVVNQGGRTLTLVASGWKISEIRRKLYSAIEMEDWNGFFYRKDIGMEFLR
jgi:phosphoribosylamine--glycine ligase